MKHSKICVFDKLTEVE